MKSNTLAVFALGLLILMFTACGAPSEKQAAEGVITMTIQVSSPAFTEGDTIPKKFSCDGTNVSPQLDWINLPAGTRSLALIVDDPDAPIGTYVHWVLFDLPADLKGLPEGVKGMGTRGKNSSNKLDFVGPCPPKGSNHRYYFKLYALDNKLSLKEGSTKADVEKAITGHILGQGQLMGKFGH